MFVLRKMWLLAAPLVLAGIWVLHGLGILVPETGFDAVWYHLPIVQTLATDKSLPFRADFYQSANPILGEIFFVPGWWLAGEMGVKATAFLFAIVCVTMVGVLFRTQVSKSWWWLILILSSLTQVIAWQSSSAYVDIPAALWQLAGLVLLYSAGEKQNSKGLFLASFIWGLSLGTKLYLIATWPVWGVLICLSRPKKWRVGVVAWLIALVPAVPFYLRTYLLTGNPFYTLSLVTNDLGPIATQSSLLGVWWYQASHFYLTPWFLLLGRDYVNWLCVLLLPWIGWALYQRKNDLWWQMMAVWTLSQLGLWWFLPPLSTRYALSGFLLLVGLSVVVLQVWWRQNPSWRSSILVVVALSVGFHLAPRLIVTKRQLPYILGSQTKTEYLHQFFDGSIDAHLKHWHHLPD